MFSFKQGPFIQYRTELFKELIQVDDSKYIFNAQVIHAFENDDYENLQDEALCEALSKDLEEMGTNLKVTKIIMYDDYHHNGWPLVEVENTKPMTLKEFLKIIDKTYFQEGISYLLDECLEIFSIVKEYNK